MAAIMGTKGSVVIDLLPAGLRSLVSRWNATITRETNDITPFSPTNNARKNLGSVISLTGGCEGFLDDAAIPDISGIFDTDATAAQMILTATTSRTYTFSAIVTDFSPSVEMGVPNAFSCNFVSTGAIVEA